MAYKRGKVWLASGYDRTLGKKKHLGTRPTKGEATKLEATWRLKNKSVGNETCDQFAERWPTDYPRPKMSTNLHLAERVKLFATDFRGVKLAGVTRPMARQWALQHRHHFPAVRAMFGDALRDGLVDFNPFVQLRVPGSRGRKDIVALTELELVELAQLAFHPGMELNAYAPEYQAMILFAGYVGLRPGELFALRRDDVHGQMVDVERAYCSKTKRVGATKTSRPRTIILPPVAQDALLQVPHHASGLLFETPMGRMWTQSSHHRYWSRLRSLAGRLDDDFYSLRHTAATILLERGSTPADVAHQLGHSDGGYLIQTLYGHPAAAGARARLLAVWADGRNSGARQEEAL